MALTGTLEPLDAESRALLKKDAPAELSAHDRMMAEAMDAEYPKPSAQDIQQCADDLQLLWQSWEDEAVKDRAVRFQRDETPAKFKRGMEGDTRIRSRLMHNEINRVVAMLTRNPYTVKSPAAGRSEGAKERAEKRRRFGQEFFPAMMRKAKENTRRRVLDAATANGMGAWEFYLDESYDRLGDKTDRYTDESRAEYYKRIGPDLQEAGPPFGLRFVDGMSLRYQEEEDGICRAVIREYKRYRTLYATMLRRGLSSEKLREMGYPKPGDPGLPYTTAQGISDKAGDYVETIRYYDRRWYAFVVAGMLVDGPMEHGMPRVPVFPVHGIVTSESEYGLRYQGITWGMRDIELALNDALTYAHDTTITYGRPKPVVITSEQGKTIPDPRNPKQMASIDLSDPKKTPQLAPGQTIVDAFEKFQPKLPELLVQTEMNLWQRSGRNPVAQGASPGADPAGYTVNTLITGADDQYGILLDNDARVAGEILDCVFAVIKYTLDMPCYLPSEGQGEHSGEMEWIVLGPDDIDNVTTRVEVDPTSEQNRLARVQTLSGGWKDGVISRKRLQKDGYGVEDSDAEDDDIVVEQVENRLLALLADQAMQKVMQGIMPEAQQAAAQATAEPSALEAQASQGASGNAATPPGPEPPPTNPPAMSPEMAAASNGPQDSSGTSNRLNASRAQAGQDRGYRPPAPAGARSQPQ